jgi:amidase
MSTDPSLHRMTASQLAAGLRKKAFSAVELCDAHVDRIEKLDGQVNAVVVRDFERARAEARQADVAISRGEFKALTGIPMTVKESFDLRGHPTTWGFEVHAEHRAREDALAVQRLKAAGAVVLGKTNVPPALADWQTENPIYGRTRNPHGLEQSAGGSSGGSAAAIAMGFSAIELGSDIGGSVRVPAAFCGVYGHKTSYGLIPMGGHFAGGEIINAQLLSVIGPLARSAEDLATALDVVAGPDAEAPANKVVLPLPRHGHLKSFRVFVLDHHPAARADSEILGALNNLADLLVKEGATVARQSSLLPDIVRSWRLYQAMLHTIITRGDPNNSRQPISAHDWLDLLDDQLRLRRQWSDFFRHFDIVLCPAFGTAAYTHAREPEWRKRALTIDGEPSKFGDQLGWAGIATVANLPSTAIPLGVNKAGLPLAVQAIGPFLEDKTTIAFAGMVGHDVVAPPIAG